MLCVVVGPHAFAWMCESEVGTRQHPSGQWLDLDRILAVTGASRRKTFRLRAAAVCQGARAPRGPVQAVRRRLFAYNEAPTIAVAIDCWFGARRQQTRPFLLRFTGGSLN